MSGKHLLPVLIFLFPHILFAGEWEKKQAPIMTTWGENIDTANVLPEYPRPQMVRPDWLNLNGIWEFAYGVKGDTYQPERDYTKKILVPFPVESALSGIMDTDYKNADKHYWYKRTFKLDKSFKKKNVLIHFGAVDWQCEVFVNGRKAGVHEGGYDPFYFDITELLTSSGEQELAVRVFDSQWAGGQPHGKQALTPNGIWYTPVTGIWQTVWLEPVTKNHISDIGVVPDIDKQMVNINVSTAGQSVASSVVIRIFDQGKLLSETKGTVNDVNEIAIESPKLWSPDSPFLYDMEIILKEGNKKTDIVKSYFGMRKIHLGKQNNQPCIFLNNQPVFQYGVLDQGWWPDGLYTAPSDEALAFDLIQMKKLGFNMVRKHVKTEPARWYHHCDRLGLLVWQDIPNGTTNTNRNDWVETNFIREMKNIMNSLKNAPSIITWVVFNEGWGQYDRKDLEEYREAYTRRAYHEARNYDSTRLVNAVSGWFDYEIGDLIDRHLYPAPGMHPNPVNHRASVCGEYGGINLKIDNHIWAGSEVNYKTVQSREELTEQFIQYADVVQSMQKDGLCAAVYTQITDVESEINGLITYDRKVVKFNDRQLERINRKITECIHNTLK